MITQRKSFAAAGIVNFDVILFLEECLMTLVAGFYLKVKAKLNCGRYNLTIKRFLSAYETSNAGTGCRTWMDSTCRLLKTE